MKTVLITRSPPRMPRLSNYHRTIEPEGSKENRRVWRTRRSVQPAVRLPVGSHTVATTRLDGAAMFDEAMHLAAFQELLQLPDELLAKGHDINTYRPPQSNWSAR